MREFKARFLTAPLVIRVDMAGSDAGLSMRAFTVEEARALARALTIAADEGQVFLNTLPKHKATPGYE